MASSAPPSNREASGSLRPRPQLRVLVGAALTSEERETLEARPEVEVHSDPAKLTQRAHATDFSLVVVDHAMPELARALVAQAKPRAPGIPMLFLAHEQVVPTVEFALRAWDFGAQSAQVSGKLAKHPGGLFAQALRIASEEIERLEVERLWQYANAPPLVASADPPAEATDAMSLLVRVRSPEQEADAKRRALEAAFRERERLLQESLSTQEVARLLGVTRQTPHDRVKARALLAVEDKGALRFPLWQFDAEGPDGTVKGLSDVLRALDVSPFAQTRWLERPNAVFEGRSPIEALKSGEVERVVREARSVGASAGNG